MPNYFPCPNSQCNYQFDADILPAAAMVTCPLCRTKFPYRANRPVPTPAGAGDAPLDAPPPPNQRVVNLREAPQSSVLPTILWVGGFCIVLALLIIGLTMRGRTLTDPTPEAIDSKFNIKVEPFPQPWDSDVNAQKPVNGNILGRKRSGPEAWAAVAAQDWVDRQPRQGELDELMRGRLKAGFATLEIEPLDGETWAGHQALAVRFTGNLDDVQMRGEAYAISYKGIGYVYFAWAPEPNWQEVRTEAAGLREKIKPAGYREKWVEKRANSVTHDGGSYQVEDTDGAWVRAKPEDEWRKEDKLKYPIDNVKDIDPAATMAFIAQYRIREQGDSKRHAAEAKALVVELPGGGDPLEAAKSHVIERIKRDFAGNPPAISLEAMNRSPSGISLPSGGAATGRFLFKNPLDRQEKVMYIISAISVGGKTIAVETHCQEKDGSYVEEWMLHLASSLKAK